MFLEFFRITGLAVMQIFILGALGYLLLKRNLLSDIGLDFIGRLVMEVTLPIFIFCRLVKDFNFNQYPNWYIFPLVSIAITVLGLILGYVFIGFIKGLENKLQFLSLVTFQNSGYLPLALVAAMLPKEKVDAMFIYIFLFLLGFNLLIWSLGVYMLTFSRIKNYKLGSLFSPPVLATLFSLIFIFLGLDRIVPDFIFIPLKMLGDCTLPLAMLVVGANLAQIHLGHIDKKANILVILTKLVILPVFGLWLVIKFNLSELPGLLVIMQLAMPSAVSLSVIMRNYKKADLLISQGVFFTHLVSLVTIPIFLSLYFMFTMRR